MDYASYLGIVTTKLLTNSSKAFFVLSIFAWSVSACTAVSDSEVHGDNNAIKGGTATSGEDYPWIASLTGEWGSCSGTVIAEDWVLTAGHCAIATTEDFLLSRPPVEWRPRTKLYERTYVTQGQDTTGGGETATEVILHPDFSYENLWLSFQTENESIIYVSAPVFRNDLALIKSPGIGASLKHFPRLPRWSPEAPEGGLVLGYGISESEGDLYRAPIAVITDDEVFNHLSETAEDFTPVDTSDQPGSAAPYISTFEPSTQFGLRNENVAVCAGDSGGPFVIERWGVGLTLVGVASTTTSCNETGKPAIYTDVAQYRDWIMSTISQ